MRLILSSFALFMFVGTVLANDVVLQWEANSEPDLSGYRIFMREASQGYDYSLPAWEGIETTCKIDGLLDNKDYRFVARAFDTEGYESKNSNEVSYSYGVVPDGLPPGSPRAVTITITVTVP